MTGFGAGRVEANGLVVSVEARAVNGRFLKLSLKTPALLASREADIEARVRDKLKRGSVSVSVYLKRTDPTRVAAINEELVAAYKSSFERLGLPTHVIGMLPGVLESGPEELTDGDWQAVETALTQALAQLCTMRDREGKALQVVLTRICDEMEVRRAAVVSRAPKMVLDYRDRLKTRLAQLLNEGTSGVDPELVAREVAVFADRSDITEELARLQAHLEQARSLMQGHDDVGRRLDFLSQEMLREVNTIGSKSQDAELARLVVDLKSLIEQLKEQVANVE